MTDSYLQIIKSIECASDIAVYCHTNPDGDTLCSGLALYTALKNMGKNASIYCDCAVPSKFFCLHGARDISFPQKRGHELAISVDCASVDRLGQCMKSYLSAKERIAIDHHKTYSKFADLCAVELCAACTQIIYKLLRHMNLVDAEVAKLLFSGIVTDSGCFAFSSVDGETHMIACELLEYEFDASQVIYDVYSSIELKKFKLKSRVLPRARFFENNQIAVILFSKKDFEATDTDISCTEGVITELINIRDVKVAYALAEAGANSYKVSIRTKAEVDASDIAMSFGGGGHSRAAGCRVNGYLEDVVDKIIKLAKDRI